MKQIQFKEYLIDVEEIDNMDLLQKDSTGYFVSSESVSVPDRHFVALISSELFVQCKLNSKLLAEFKLFCNDSNILKYSVKEDFLAKLYNGLEESDYVNR